MIINSTRMMSRMQTVGVQRNGSWDWSGMEMFPWCPLDVPKHDIWDEEVFCIKTSDGTYEWDMEGGAALTLDDKIVKYWPGRPNINDLVNSPSHGAYVRFFQNGEIFMRWENRDYYWSRDIPCETKVYKDNDYPRYWMTA